MPSRHRASAEANAQPTPSSSANESESTSISRSSGGNNDAATESASSPPPLSWRQRRKRQADEDQQQPPRPISDEEWAEMRQKARLSIPSFFRIPIAAVGSFAVGMGLGMFQGSKMAGLRFRAEHAHKLPKTTKGWYFYHKSKNYHVALGGIKEGLKMGPKVSFWTTALFSIENLFDSYRGSADLINTVLASVTVSGAFSLWNRFPLIMAARTTKSALLFGLVVGGMQDLVGFARGRPIGYVDFVKRRIGKQKDQEGDSSSTTKP